MGYTIARRAKAAAATLSAAALGASALVSAARGTGGDTLLLGVLTAANDNLPADLQLSVPTAAADGDEEARAWCDAVWQQIRLLLVAWGVRTRTRAHNALGALPAVLTAAPGPLEHLIARRYPSS